MAAAEAVAFEQRRAVRRDRGANDAAIVGRAALATLRARRSTQTTPRRARPAGHQHRLGPQPLEGLDELCNAGAVDAGKLERDRHGLAAAPAVDRPRRLP